MQTIRTAVNDVTSLLTKGGLPSPRLDAEVMIARCLEKDRAYLYTHPEAFVTQQVQAALSTMVRRRLRGEPVAYITGWKEFWSLNLRVDPRVLIPRPESEHLVEEALKVLAPSRNFRGRILDVGTGSGALALALADELPEAVVVAVDISPEAVAVAAENARHLRLDGRVFLVVGDLLTPFSGPFDLVVTNPPYIPDGMYDMLPPGVRMFEPSVALRGGRDGMDFYRALIPTVAGCLRPGGTLLMEVGADQGLAVREMLRAEGSYDAIRIVADYTGRDRVVGARRV